MPNAIQFHFFGYFYNNSNFIKNTHKYYSYTIIGTGGNEDDADETEAFLAAEKAKAAALIGNYEPADGEFSSFPEIHKRTVTTL